MTGLFCWDILGGKINILFFTIISCLPPQISLLTDLCFIQKATICYCLSYLRSAQVQHQTMPVMQAHHVTHILISYSKEFQAYPVLPTVQLWTPQYVQRGLAPVNQPPDTDVGFILISLVFRWCNTYNCTLMNEQLINIQSGELKPGTLMTGKTWMLPTFQ